MINEDDIRRLQQIYNVHHIQKGIEDCTLWANNKFIMLCLVHGICYLPKDFKPLDLKFARYAGTLENSQYFWVRVIEKDLVIIEMLKTVFVI